MNTEQTAGHGKFNGKHSGRPEGLPDGNSNGKSNGRPDGESNSQYDVECHFTTEDYDNFRTRLYSDEIPAGELRKICMTLAHAGTEEAQEILETFRESDRATEVEWLECAVDEGRYNFMTPRNDREERDYLALKVLQELLDDIVQLEVEFNDARIQLDKLDIEHEAVKELVQIGEVEKVEEISFHPLKERYQSKLENLGNQIDVKDKTYDRIKLSIKTERYKNADPMMMRDIHYG